MALHPAFDQIKLFHHADIALAVTHNLPFAHHCGKSAAEYFVFFCGDPDQFIQGLFPQCRMGAQGNHEIEFACLVQDVNQGAKEDRQWQRAGVVGDEHQDFLTRKAPIETFVEGFEDFLFQGIEQIGRPG